MSDNRRETIAKPEQPLVDSFGRVHSNLRISVTDRCNIRCFYCMPNEDIEFQPRSEILSFEEIQRFVRAVVPLGINRLRITGGEPLVRADVVQLIANLAAIPGIDDLAMTTNGLLLAQHAQGLREAGLDRLNISLDAISEENFERIARRRGLQRVMDGIAAAQAAGFEKIRLNAVAIQGITEDEAVPLAKFARDHGLELRFIEFMPLDAEGNWQSQQVLDAARLKRIIEEGVQKLRPCERPDPSQPAVDYEYVDGSGRIGLIAPVSQPFCANCNRLRITADGKVRNCLFSMAEWDARRVLRETAVDQPVASREQGVGDRLRQLVRDCIGQKKPAHGIDTPEFARPKRAMYQIGG